MESSIAETSTKARTEVEMVEIPKDLAFALCGVLAAAVGLSAKDQVFIQGILDGEHRSLEQKTRDGLVLNAQRYSLEIGSAVGYVLNDPKLVGFGRGSSGGYSFVQVAKSVTG